jgi:O-antigen ligase
VIQAARGLVLACVAWGAFAFGAPYPWAYWPLAAASSLAGAIGLLLPSTTRRPLGLTPLALAVAAFLVLALLQLIPLSPSLLAALSPHLAAALTNLFPEFAFGVNGAHPLSVNPASTIAGIGLAASFALLMFGTARLLSLSGVRDFARELAIVGTCMAFVGVVQRPMFGVRIYGFWVPRQGGYPFGPFVDRNHFAGWMLLALPVVLGLILAVIAKRHGDQRDRIRDRVLWLGSADGSRWLLLCAAAAAMAFALMLTLSRSGITALVLACTVMGTLALRGQPTPLQRGVAIAVVLSVLVLCVSWIGASRILTQFQEVGTELVSRRSAWSEALAIFRQYPLTGTGLYTYDTIALLYLQQDFDHHLSAAHNDYLQLLAEGGMLLAIPFVACVVAFVAAVRRRFLEEDSVTAYWIRAGAVTGLLAIALQEAGEFPLQMPGIACLCAVVCGIALHRAPRRRVRHS